MKEISHFEIDYNQKISKFSLLIMLAHFPIFLGLAYFMKSELKIALACSLFIYLGSLVTHHFKKGDEITHIVNAISLMAFSAIFIHLGRGIIEFHFHIFCFITYVSLFASWKSVVTALTVVALHHIGFFFLLPTSLFNYEASFGIVLLHAAFAIVNTCFALVLSIKMRDMLSKQGTTFIQIKDVTSKNSSMSTQLERDSRDLASGATEQASGFHEAAELLGSVATVSERTFQKVVESQESSQKGLKLVEHGESLVVDLLQSIENIKAGNTKLALQMDKNGSEMQRIIEAINNISEYTKVINDIVFQTKLLSFNASVEASRAGEHGKGFSIVAQEVGNLALQSGTAAAEIEQIISESANLVKNIVEQSLKDTTELMKVSEKSIEYGGESTHKIERIFGEFKGQSMSLQNTFMEFSQSMTEQRQSIDRIKDSMRELSKLTDGNQEKSGRILTIAEDLNQTAQTMEILSLALSERKAS